MSNVIFVYSVLQAKAERWIDQQLALGTDAGRLRTTRRPIACDYKNIDHVLRGQRHPVVIILDEWPSKSILGIHWNTATALRVDTNISIFDF